MLVRSRTLVTAALSCSLLFGATVNGTGVAIAYENVSMAAQYEPRYESLETRLGSSGVFPKSVEQSVENLAELPEETRFLLEGDSFSIIIDDGLLASRLDPNTGEIRHTLGASGISYTPGEMKRSYTDRVTVKVVYPDGSFDRVTPHSVVYVADSIYYGIESTGYPKVRNGQTVKIPLRVTDGGTGAVGGVPQGSKVVRDRYGSIENAELMGAIILIDEKTGDLTFTAPDDRTGQLWFRTEVTFPDGSDSEVQYVIEVTDQPEPVDDIRPVGSSLSS